MATVAVGVDQFQRFLSFDFSIGLHTCALGIGLHNSDLLVLSKWVPGLALTTHLGTLHWAPLRDDVVDSLVVPDSLLLPL